MVTIVAPKDATAPSWKDHTHNGTSKPSGWQKRWSNNPWQLGAKNWSVISVMRQEIKKLIKLLSKIFGGGQTAAPAATTKRAPYQYRPQKTLTPQELLGYLPIAGASTAIYRCDDSWLEGSDLSFVDLQDLHKNHGEIQQAMDAEPLLQNVLNNERCFYDLRTGFKMGIIRDDNDPQKYYISFGPMTSCDELTEDEDERKAITKAQKKAAIDNLRGGSPDLYRQAHRMVQCLLDAEFFNDKEVIFTGQCIGGSLANYVALMEEREAVIFNSLPIGRGLQREIGKDRLDQAQELITAIGVKNDWASNLKIINYLEKAIEVLFAVRLPGVFGKRVGVPTAYGNDIQSSHIFLMSSIAKHLGYDMRDKPGVIFAGEALIERLQNVIKGRSLPGADEAELCQLVEKLVRKTAVKPHGLPAHAARWSRLKIHTLKEVLREIASLSDNDTASKMLDDIKQLCAARKRGIHINGAKPANVVSSQSTN